MKTRTQRILFFGFLALFFLAWVALLRVISPTEVVAAIGAENVYIVTFLLAVVAGASSLTSTTFYATLATLAAGGSNPLLLSLSGGVGLFVSDTIFYYVALYGRRAAEVHWRSVVERITHTINKLPAWAVFGSVYVYTGLTPLPADILLAALAFSDMDYKRFMPYLLAGNITLVFVIGYLTQLIVQA